MLRAFCLAVPLGTQANTFARNCSASSAPSGEMECPTPGRVRTVALTPNSCSIVAASALSVTGMMESEVPWINSKGVVVTGVSGLVDASRPEKATIAATGQRPDARASSAMIEP